MSKFLDFKNYQNKYKIIFLASILLIFIFILATLNNKQFRILGVETLKIISQETPVIDAIQRLDVQVYQLTIQGYRIGELAMASRSSYIELQIVQDEIKQYDDLLETIEKNLQQLEVLMKDYAKLEMPSEKRRWKRLQADRQLQIQASEDLISTSLQQHKSITEQSLVSLSAGQIEKSLELKSQLISIENTLHEEIDKLSTAAYTGITSSGNKIAHIEYGARQITYFILFWFFFIGIGMTYVTIRWVASSNKSK